MAYNLKCLKFALVLSTSFVNMNSISFHQLIGPNGVTKHTMNISLSNLKEAIDGVMLLCVLLEWLTSIQVFIFESLNFCILESWDNFIGLYFNGTKSKFLKHKFPWMRRNTKSTKIWTLQNCLPYNMRIFHCFIDTLIDQYDMKLYGRCLSKLTSPQYTKLLILWNEKVWVSFEKSHGFIINWFVVVA